MKKIKYKFLVAFLFSVFATLVKLLLQDADSPVEMLFNSQSFWTSFLLFWPSGMCFWEMYCGQQPIKKLTIKTKFNEGYSS